VTANTTLTSSLYAVNVNAASGPITITLPTAVATLYQPVVAKIDSSANVVNVVTVGGQSINTVSSNPQLTIAYQFSAVTFRSDNANWWIN
jgi:hypothetical protein